MHGWITGSGTNYSMSHHNHAGCQISAVFYLLSDVIDDSDKGGEILFTDPRQNANRGYDESFIRLWRLYLAACAGLSLIGLIGLRAKG
jgi:hypothetical protein